ncbi:regulator of volume decrease after cellular swelling-domain-containing protein, partial [Pyronema domesticum]
MPLTIIRSPPSADSYEPLSSFQAATPASFSTPVLHHHEVNAKVLLSRDQASLIPIFLPADSKQGDADTESTDEIIVDGIDLWVTNENLIFFNTPLSVGAVIPYLSLTLHAVTTASLGTGLYLQISLTPDISTTSNADNYDDEELLELTLIPTGTEDKTQKQISDIIFKELSVCTSLHSAASGSEDEDDGDRIMFEGDNEEGDAPYARLEGFPGEGGWITAENVDQFRFEDVDVEVPFTILGPGAGVVRQREDEEEEVEEEGEEGGKGETKWRR